MKPDAETALESLLLNPDGPTVTAIGGGHGQAAALEAIQCYAGEIFALVAVGDNGGSSGRLSGLGIPPPGDIRRCLLALTPEPSLWSELFGHRFTGGDVADHSLGNLILAALTDLYGDFESAVETAERMLGTLGSVMPVGDRPITLEAVIEGRRVVGQREISGARGEITELHIKPRDAATTRRALTAVAAADQIVVGPGSLYTSTISALKLNMLTESILSAKAQRVFVLNLVTQDGETLDMDGGDHLDALAAHVGVIGPGVVVVHEGALDVPTGHDRVTVTESEAARHGWDIVLGDIADQQADWPSHDPFKLGRVLEELATKD